MELHVYNQYNQVMAMLNDLFHRSREKDLRLFFCINSGRSGSNYLSNLLGTAKEVFSEHEASPQMIGSYLEMVSTKTFQETYNARRIKIDAIQKKIDVLPKGKNIYCETNHMFIKTFFDVVMDEFGKEVEILILRRDLTKVLKSFIELGYFSQHNDVWPLWMSSPNAKTASLTCISKDKDLDQYDLCIAYLLDIEARVERFQRNYPSTKTYEIRIENLNDFSNIRRIFGEMKITPTRMTKDIYAKKANGKSYRKKEIGIRTDLDYCRQRIEEYIREAKRVGIEIPPKVALDFPI